MRTSAITSGNPQQISEKISELETQKKIIYLITGLGAIMTVATESAIGFIIAAAIPGSNRQSPITAFVLLILATLAICGIGIVIAIRVRKEIKNINTQLEELRGNSRKPLLPMAKV